MKLFGHFECSPTLSVLFCSFYLGVSLNSSISFSLATASEIEENLTSFIS